MVSGVGSITVLQRAGRTDRVNEDVDTICWADGRADIFVDGQF